MLLRCDFFRKRAGDDSVSDGVWMNIRPYGCGRTHPGPTQCQKDVHRKIYTGNEREVADAVGSGDVSHGDRERLICSF
jgi:hypothetical protein